jgi:hypothetical protein
MRSTCRTVLTAAVAVLVLGAASASAASAHSYIIAGNPLGKPVLASSKGGTANLEWSFSGSATIHVECSKSTIDETLSYEGKSTGTVILSGCILVGHSNCKVESIHAPYRGELAGSKGALTDQLYVEKHFAVVIGNANEEKPTCGFKGTWEVTGGYRCTLPEIETEALEHEAACKSAGSELTIAGAALTLSYSGKLSLETGQKWSAS